MGLGSEWNGRVRILKTVFTFTRHNALVYTGHTEMIINFSLTICCVCGER